MSQYYFCLSEIWIQLSVLQFHSQNLATLSMSKLGNWHCYNIENWTVDVITFSSLLYIFLCIRTHSLIYFFFNFKSKKQKSLRILQCRGPTAASSYCLVCLGTSGSPKSLAELAGAEQRGWWKQIGLGFALI